MGQSESISSKKMTQGAELRARMKHARTARSLSPTYIFNNSGPKNEEIIENRMQAVEPLNVEWFSKEVFQLFADFEK